MDIKRLYTQVPLNEVFVDIIETIYDKNINSVCKGINITKPILKKILKLCLQIVFLYDDKVYRRCCNW